MCFSMFSSMTQRQRSWLSIAGIWAVLLVSAATRPLALPDEGRYAEVGRWMWMSGDWLAPRLDGLPFFHKPPLLHWLQASSFAVLGVNPWSARLIPALHAGLMLIGLYLVTRHEKGERVARTAVLMLGSSLGILIGGQYVNHDMLVASWISIAVWAFASAINRDDDLPDVRLALIGFAACALGLLSKGLIGVVLPGAVLMTWLCWTGQHRRLLLLPWVRGLFVFGTIGLPWFIAAQIKYAGLFDYLIIGQHFSRFTGNTFNNQWSWWFYPLVLICLLFPWSLICIAGARPSQWLEIWRIERTAIDHRWTSLQWIWVMVITAFFSFPKSKIVGYIFPVLPPLACIASMIWHRWRLKDQVRARSFFTLMIISLGLSLGVNELAIRHTLKHASQDVAQVLRCAMDADDRVYVTGDYPYDLPFYAQLSQALVVVEDWEEARRSSGDNWRRELFEAADFDSVAAPNLQPKLALYQARVNAWLVTPNDFDAETLPPGWYVNFKGKAWTLWARQSSRVTMRAGRNIDGPLDCRGPQ